jgi:predicted transcriptional regulator
VPPERWEETSVAEVATRTMTRIEAEHDVAEALRLLDREHSDRMLLVGPENGPLEGIVTKTDILHALREEDGGERQK